MSDIVEQLRDSQHRFIFQGNSKLALSIASEIERLRAENTHLRARVEVLERVLHGIAEFCEEGDRRTFIPIANTVRAALEAKP
jgi:hypothetical protein